MSTLSDTLRRMASLVWPRRCAVCGGELPAGADTTCTMCRYTAPLTGYWRMEDNPLAQRLDALAGVGRAAALIFFSGGGWRESIHGFKYGGRWRSARTLGRWLGAEMKSSGLYDDIDLVVPVPLHYRKAAPPRIQSVDIPLPRASRENWALRSTAVRCAAAATTLAGAAHALREVGGRRRTVRSKA